MSYVELLSTVPTGALCAGSLKVSPLEHLLRLNHETARPLYLQLEEQLVELIESGQLAVGDTLPPERKLAEALGISRSTVQQSYALLRERQLLAGQGRRGSIIQAEAARLRPGMDRLTGFTEEMEKAGRAPSVRVLEHRIVEDRSVASLFGLPSTAKFLRLVRVRLGDDVPLSRESAWYSLDAAPFLADADPEGNRSTRSSPKMACRWPPATRRSKRPSPMPRNPKSSVSSSPFRAC
jgi:GntR family transcriptional regulator